jgi:hypothetical protein
MWEVYHHNAIAILKIHAFYGNEPYKKHDNDTRRPPFNWIKHFFQ